MAYSIEIDVEDVNGEYEARVKGAPSGNKARSPDPMVAIRGALAASQGYIDGYVGYDRDRA